MCVQSQNNYEDCSKDQGEELTEVYLKEEGKEAHHIL